MEPTSASHLAVPVPAAGASQRPAFHLDVAAATDRGLERSGNEDSFLVLSPPGWAVLAVCDGMGGAAGGEVASRTTVDVLREVVTAGGPPLTRDALGRRLLHGVEEAARRVFDVSRRTHGLSGMGTTATACALTGDVLYLAQVGDSRAYLLREGRLTQLTRDQTLVTLLLERGQLTPEEVPDFPHPNVILQAVGTAERVEVDLTRVGIARGDVLLVCSDGLHGHLPHDALRAVLAREPTPSAACEALIALANARGGPDNITAIVAHVGGDALEAPSGPPTPEKARLDEDETLETTPLAEPAPPAQPTQVSSDAMEEGVFARLAAIFRRRRDPTT